MTMTASVGVGIVGEVSISATSSFSSDGLTGNGPVYSSVQTVNGTLEDINVGGVVDNPVLYIKNYGLTYRISIHASDAVDNASPIAYLAPGESLLIRPANGIPKIGADNGTSDVQVIAFSTAAIPD